MIRLWKIMFDNDRAVAEGIGKIPAEHGSATVNE